jgi:hypothetical protein
MSLLILALFLYYYYNRWVQIASYLPNRTDNDVKNRFYSQMRIKTRIENGSRPRDDFFKAYAAVPQQGKLNPQGQGSPNPQGQGIVPHPNLSVVYENTRNPISPSEYYSIFNIKDPSIFYDDTDIADRLENAENLPAINDFKLHTPFGSSVAMPDFVHSNNDSLVFPTPRIPVAMMPVTNLLPSPKHPYQLLPKLDHQPKQDLRQLKPAATSAFSFQHGASNSNSLFSPAGISDGSNHASGFTANVRCSEYQVI